MAMAELMQGFPPTPAEQVTLANWRTAPFNRWAFHHVREILPTADIANDSEHVRALPEAPCDLDALAVTGPDGRRRTFGAFVEETLTDATVVLHRGKVVYERYGAGMTAASPHILMSVSKSMLGLLAGVLSHQGALPLDRLVADVVPEVEGTAYKGATIRELLDMRVGIAFDEDYLATGGAIVAYRKATGWNPLGPGEAASDLRSFYRVLTQTDGPHGGRFHYISPNTDLLGWVIERAAGRRYADLMSELIWQPTGARFPAYITVDRLGAPRCAGGMCTTAVDLARVGQMILEEGTCGGRQVLPAGWIRDILQAGDPAAWDAGSFVPYFPGLAMHYRAKWYVVRDREPLLFGFGIHGQNLFIDPARGLVVAKFSSQAQPLDAQAIALTLSAVGALRTEFSGG
jgi:CubicO group peptidase (beta-lactamase class C family)